MNGLRVWANDTSASENVHIFLWESCLPEFGAGSPVITELLDRDFTTGSTGDQSDFATFTPTTANTVGCWYTVRARMGLDNNCNGLDLRLYKVRVQYLRQVSPAPGVATFSDVPTNHPFFQHIEALVDSGITSGCGATTYCPDANVTRGQMAVFLAKALGLHWSQYDF